MVPKPKNNNAGNVDIPKKSHTVLPTGEKMKVHTLTGKKRFYEEIAKIYGKNETSEEV